MKIEAKDLRVGNYINTPNGIQKVEEFGLKGFEKTPYACFGGISGVFLEACSGIEITPEILRKCGFEKEGNWAVLSFQPRMCIRFYNFNSAECDIVQDDKFIAFKNSHLKYLHQLQNLYYALTGEELDVNL